MQDSTSTSAKQEQQERPLLIAASFLIIALATLFGEGTNDTYGGNALLIGVGWTIVAIAFGMQYVRSRVSSEWPRFVGWTCLAANVSIVVYLILA